MPRFCRATALVLILVLFCTLSATPILGTTPQRSLPLPVTAPPAVSAAAAALFDPVSEEFLFLKNADVRHAMASTTKVMTALVVLERADLAATVVVPREAVGVEGSSIYLFEGEEITVRTLLYALLLSSANDAAAALAYHVAGSIEGFAALMNEKAAAMGLPNTHFTNPHGLYDEAHYTTARELALITAEAMKNATFAEIVATVRYEAPQNGTDATRLFLNHNRLLRTYEGACGVKTGFTKKSGRCLVSAAERDALTLIAVTLDAPGDWQDHAALLDWGFSEYEGFCPQPTPVEIPVVGGTAPKTMLTPQGAVRLTLPRGHGEITATVEAPRFLYAGFEGGKTVGQIVYRLNGKIIATLPLQTTIGVERVRLHRSLLEKLKDIFVK